MRTTCRGWFSIKEFEDDSVVVVRMLLLFTTTPVNDDGVEAVLPSNGIWAKFLGVEISATEACWLIEFTVVGPDVNTDDEEETQV